MQTAQFDQLISLFAQGASAEDVWRTFSPMESHANFCDHFALHVGQGYLNGSLTYVIADRAMNGLYLYCYHLGVDRGMSDYAFRMFNAFEEGEYTHEGDLPETDQHERYVRPRVLELVAAAD